MIIDFHTHAFADNIAEKAIPKLSSVSGIIPNTKGTLASIKNSMERANIDYSVVCNIATNPKQMTSVNNWAIANNQLPFIQFGSIHPQNPDWAEELERLKENGIKGIKLHPDYQGYFIDDDFMFDIYRKIVELDFVLLIHSGYDIGLHDPVHCTPKRFANVIDKIDTSKFILAHLGGAHEWQELIDTIAGASFYIDTAFSLCDRMTLEDIKSVISAHGIDKVLFATDSPWAEQKEYAEYIISNFEEPERSKILYQNGARLLNI